LDGAISWGKSLNNRKKSFSAYWDKDSTTLIEISKYMSLSDSSKVDFIINDAWTLSGDGGEMTLKRMNQSNIGDSWSQIAIYEKRAAGSE
jgi:hypothetical protein